MDEYAEIADQHTWYGGPPHPLAPLPPAAARVPARRPHRARLGLTVLALGVATAGIAVSADRTGSAGAAGAAATTSAPAAAVVPATTTGGTVASSAAAVTPGVVDVTSRLGYANATAAGTGMVLSSTGEVVTNNHVVADATSITVTVVSTGRQYPASVVGTSASEDVAVIQLQGASGLATVPVSKAASSVGQGVVAIGNAGGKGGAPSVVSGSITATGRTITATDETGSSAEQLTDLIETDASVVAGDSGGPLASLEGTVISMDTAASSGGADSSGADSSAWGGSDSGSDGAASVGSAAHRAYAIPIARVLTVVAQIDLGTASSTVQIGSRGFIGVSVQDVGVGGSSGDGSGSAGGASAAGATVSGVVAGGPAASAGLQAGDVVTSIGGAPISSATGLTTVLRTTRAGQRILLGWTGSDGQQHSATLTLIAGPAQ